MSRQLLTCLLFVLAWLPSLVAPAHAQSTEASIERFVLREARSAALSGTASPRVEVQLGRLDARLQLAPCGHIEPFLPPGSRLWGKAHVGLRCADTGAHAARWQVYLPVQVRVFGPALVATRPIAAGQSIGAEDVTVNEDVEWSREPQGVLIDLTQLDGRVLSRPLAAGQPIPLSVLRAAQVLAAGDQVRIVGQGKGFAITSQAVAIAAAHEGQSVRVRLDSGRVLTGIARSGRWVEVTF